jgi:hypothetical protein
MVRYPAPGSSRLDATRASVAGETSSETAPPSRWPCHAKAGQTPVTSGPAAKLGDLVKAGWDLGEYQ